MNFDDYKLEFQTKASLVSIVCDRFEAHKTTRETLASLRELRELLRTLDVACGEEYIQNRQQLDPATMIGEGKLKEIADEFIDLDDGVEKILLKK